ncbi:MAG TPA: LacI family DNA-binding transcriptional regulator [Candidatus Sumerlaeota bacterium]|nr:LacI family DNA-binding transcriptional regulator [Candidatus Sumerlaeota bacterium]
MSGNTKNIVTVKEIAKRAGVSVSTVSRVLSGVDTMIPISEKTRRRVLQVCEEMQFLPDVNHGRLQTRRSHTIALLVRRYSTTIPDQFIFDEAIGRFLSTLETDLGRAGYVITIQGVDDEYEDSREYLKILRNNTADGLVVWGAFRGSDAYVRLRDEQRPSIAVAFPNDQAANFIMPDNEQGAYDITRHLLSVGHRKIALMNAGSGEIVDTLRERGYQRAIQEAGGTPVLLRANYSVKGGMVAAEKLFANRDGVTAVFAANDLMAIGTMQVAQRHGLRVPEDFAIAGFDGSSHGEITSPPITTGRLPLEEMGTLAARHIVEMIEGKNTGGCQITLPVEVLRRKSTGG